MARLAESLDTMTDDWLSMTTFVDLQLSAIQTQAIATQNLVLADLSEYFGQPDHLENLSAIAWDLIIPLSHFIKCPDTKLAALKLFDLAVEHGNQKEVLLKLIEASELVNLEDSEDVTADLDLQLKLLMAQETVLKRIRTKKPTLFIAEYTKSIIKALQSASIQSEMQGAVQLYKDHISKSLEQGALHRLEQDDAISEKESHNVNALLRSFITYVVEFITVMPAVPYSFELFLQHHPQLSVPNSIKTATPSEHACDSFLKQLNSRFSDMTDLWDCGGLARQEAQVSEHDDDHDSDIGLDEGDVPLSSSGSVILLAKLLREEKEMETQSQKIPVIPLLDRSSKCQEILMEICIQQVPSDVTLDASLYLCGLVVAELLETKTLMNSDDHLLLIQTLSSISATAAHAGLRQVAHYLSKDALAASTERFKLNYYNGVLDDCPYEALKSATVGMIKDDIASNTEFWTTEDNLMPLLRRVFIVNHEDSIEVDDYRVQFWVQTINLVIFLLQKFPRSAPIRIICRKWIDALKVQLAAISAAEARQERDAVNELFDMYLTRTEELLIRSNECAL